LLITGGCCHDYAKQKTSSKRGWKARELKVDQIHTDDKSTKPPLAILGIRSTRRGTISSSTMMRGRHQGPGDRGRRAEAAPRRHPRSEPALRDALLSRGQSRHSADGWHAGVALVRLSRAAIERHGAQLPIALTFLPNASPITKGFSDWTTIKEELYNNIQIFPSAKPLVKGKQTVTDKEGKTKENEFVWADESLQRQDPRF